MVGKNEKKERTTKKKIKAIRIKYCYLNDIFFLIQKIFEGTREYGFYLVGIDCYRIENVVLLFLVVCLPLTVAVACCKKKLDFFVDFFLKRTRDFLKSYFSLVARVELENMKTFELLLFLVLFHCYVFISQSNEELIYQWKYENGFNGELIKELKNYQLKFSIDSRNCNENSKPLKQEDLLFVSDSQYAREKVLKYFGPDEILVEIAGKTFQTILPQYIVCHSYSASFAIEDSGVYHISVIVLHSNYTAVSENEWSSVHYNTVFKEWVILNGSYSKSETECVYDAGGVWKANSDNYDLKNGIFDNLDLAKANPIRTIYGDEKKLQMPFYVNFAFPYENGRLCVHEVNQYSWNLESCGNNSFSREEASKLLENKLIVFSGDSQMRTFAIHFFQYACHIKHPFKYSHPPIFYVPKNHPFCANTRIHFLSDAYCTVNAIPQYLAYTTLGNGQRSATRLPKVNLFISNCGHHPAGSFSLQKYAELIEGYADQLVNFGFNSQNFLWLETVALPLRQDPLIVQSKDQRSIQRMKLYNVIVNEIMAKKGLSIARYFSPTLPLVNKVCDMAHYTALHSNVPTIQEVLRHLKSQYNK